MLTNTAMKIIKSPQQITPFGGLTFVYQFLDHKQVGQLLNSYLCKLPNQSKYTWKDIIYSLWAIPFCGGDCIEDLSINLKNYIQNIPYFSVPSSDSVLKRLKELAKPQRTIVSKYSGKTHDFSINMALNKLNIKLIKKMGGLDNKPIILDYDNTIITTEKSDSRMSYIKQKGYCPGVGIIGDKIVYVENRNGNSDAQTYQEKTVTRMFKVLKSEGITIDVFRADSASYQLQVIEAANKYASKFYIKARIDQTVAQAINSIDEWTPVKINNEELLMGSTTYTPFHRSRSLRKKGRPLSSYRLVVMKVPRKDRQVNLFTNEAFLYKAIITSDYEMADIEVFNFYNQRGGAEKEFDVLKNDFGWNCLPFSNLNENTVFMIFTAMCRNVFSFVIKLFSIGNKLLQPNFRLKKFIFRFVNLPAKWLRRSRENVLNIYCTLPDI
jgi:hypothetical protein